MNVVLFGPPGSGKGTHAVRLSSRIGSPHVATGDILRRNLRERTELGLQAKVFMESGRLVPDELTCGMVASRLEEPDCAPGVLFDGFPRSIAQARWLLAWWAERGQRLDRVVSLLVPDDVIVERLSGRRACLSCGATWHVVYNPTGDICKTCGGAVTQRSDDSAEVVLARLATYRRETEPVLAVLAEQAEVRSVDAVGEIDAIYERIAAALA